MCGSITEEVLVQVATRSVAEHDKEAVLNALGIFMHRRAEDYAGDGQYPGGDQEGSRSATINSGSWILQERASLVPSLDSTWTRHRVHGSGVAQFALTMLGDVT